MLTTSSDERDLVASLRSGAQGYLVKDMEPDQLIESLHEIVSGRTVVAVRPNSQRLPDSACQCIRLPWAARRFRKTSIPSRQTRK